MGIGVMTAALLTGCGSSDSDISIAVIPKGTTHVFWKSIHAGAEMAASELGIEVIWQGPQKEDDREMQINVVQNFISRGIDAIVLAPLDEAALIRPVENARKRDIPVVVIDSDLRDPVYNSFVATDNHAGGVIAARRLAEILDSKGNVLMMRYAEGSASTNKREQGFLEGLAEAAPEMTVVSADQYGGVTAESALQAGQNLLNKFGDTLDGVFCPNESTTFGMLRALQMAGKAGSIKFVGFDSSEPLINAMHNGDIQGLVVQNPFKMGYLGVKTAWKVMRDEEVDKRIDTGVMLVTPENIDEPETVAVISPDLEKWLGE
jgi:ribose transport system substrate-binding protein